jgi:DnaJ homolog subfamily C member 19
MMKLLILALLIGGAFYVGRRFLKGSSVMTVDEARRVLGVSANADVEAINAAHRNLIAKIHPDRGGTVELAARVNTARDVLLRQLPR